MWEMETVVDDDDDGFKGMVMVLMTDVKGN